MSSLQLNAFDTNITDDCVILCQGPFPHKVFPNIQEIIHRPRDIFRKRIYLTTQPILIGKIIPPPYDTTFIYKDLSDWSLIISYINYVQKPALILAEDIQIPEQVFVKIKSIKGVTVVHVMTTLTDILRPYNCIFFAPVDNITSELSQFIFRHLQTHCRPTITSGEFKEIIQELGIVKAGLVWSTYKENNPSGSIYWYEPLPPQTSDYFSKKQLSEIFDALSFQFSY